MAATPCRKVGSRRALVYPMLSETVNSRRVYRKQGRKTTQRQKTLSPQGAVTRATAPCGLIKKAWDPRLLVKRLATATGGLGIGVRDLEARLHQAVNVVDFRTGEIQSALHVNKDFHSIADEHLVVGVLLFLKPHLVLQTRTAATNYAHTQSIFLLHISRGKLPNLGGGSICNGNHLYPPVSYKCAKGLTRRKLLMLPK